MATFEKHYFVGAKVSNYRDYRKRKFEQQAKDLDALFRRFGLMPEKAHIVDFGCATGGLIRELKKLGYRNLQGTDISQWAIDCGISNYGLGSELQYYNRNILRQNPLDAVLFLDVLEHIPEYEIEFLLSIMSHSKVSYAVCRIPVSLKEGEDFMLDVSRNDKTHITCHSKNWWISLFAFHGYSLAMPIKTNSIYDSEGVMCGVFKCRP